MKIFYALLLLTSITLAQYNTPGTGVKWNMDSLVIHSNGTVTGSFPQYEIKALVIISQNDLLSIQPGARINFTTATTAGIEVNGKFKAIGTAADSIVFTSPVQDTINGAWASVRFNETADDTACLVKYAKFSYAYSGIRAVEASPTVTNCYFFKCRRGLMLSSSDAVIKNNIIERSYEYGINLTLSSSPLIEGNILRHNNTKATSPQNQISIGLQGNNSPIIRNNTIFGGNSLKTGGISIWVSGSSAYSNAIIENNVIYKNSFGIVLQSSSGGQVNVIIRGNKIFNNNINPDVMTTGSGINLAGSTANQPIITRNEIYGNWWGITIQNGATIQAGPSPKLGDLSNSDTTDDGNNTIYGNIQGAAVYDLYNNCSNSIKAENNNWMVYDSSSIEAHIQHKADDPAKGLVDFMPFKDSVWTPVELTSFSAAADGEKIRLYWQTATETNNRGFEIERKDGMGEGQWKSVGFINGRGTTVQPGSYTFTDNTLSEEGRYLYRLRQVDFDGTFSYSQSKEVEFSLLRQAYELKQNYPNPFNPATVITYSVPAGEAMAPVQLKVYDVLGNEVAVLVNEAKAPGTYKAEFSASAVKRGLGSGVYFYELKAGKFREVRKMSLIK